jgi:hypothetical protein
MSSYTDISSSAGKIPLYVLRHAKDGAVESPQARAELLARTRHGDFRDVYVFVHGWNNDFADAAGLFTRFFEGFVRARRPRGEWRPVFVGVQWPSIVLLLPWEQGPQIAATDETFARAVNEIAGSLPDGQRQRFVTLAGRTALDADEALEMAGLAQAAVAGSAADFDGDARPSAPELVRAAEALGPAGGAAAPTGDFGFADERPAGPEAAGRLGFLDPRNLVRAATVYTMKDRAGVIGSVAVRGLVEDLSAAGASLRMIGHSYGARVILAALATASLTGPVRSVLLLQPAINQYCFADPGQVPKTGGAGGFRRALEQVALPIYTTFSPHDVPLHRTFHLALRRAKDLGEAEIAAGAPPSIYCALGGYGPQGLAPGSVVETPIRAAGDYTYAAGTRVVALDGSGDRIGGHGDVTNAYTFWALAEQDARDATRASAVGG